MEIIVVTEVDHDKNTLNNAVYERQIELLIKEALKTAVGTPKVRTDCFFEYGEPL